MHGLNDALAHALPAACGCVAIGTVISSIRSRRVKGPPSLFVALGVGCGVFRYINRRRRKKKSKLAAWVASLVVFRLCSDQHKYVLLSYACVETMAQLYSTSTLARKTPPTVRWLLEQCAAMAITARLIHTNLVHPDWMLPVHLSMMDHQSSLSTTRLQAVRQNLQTSAVTRCTSLHPGRSCIAFAGATCIKLLGRSAQIFVPLHGLTLLYSLATTRHVSSVQCAAVGLCRSLAFMTSSYMLAYSTSCLLPQKNDLAMIKLTSLTPFLAQYLEPTSRRTSIIKAVACYSLVSVYIQLAAKHEWLSKQSKVAAVLFASCMTYVLQNPHRQSRWAMQCLYGDFLDQPDTTKAAVETAAAAMA
ncbi:hypothetical protein H310_12207 [Aphanomyces invadans]|uniref:Transmembrane protein 135 N-terminal domain-containing protein n=1 Tax=Aphanomyces invadans TaxID=157072 RepID=A0A024TI82_9STRA|nr:hypothetical protein H310_12207 [Aphanomyces invadans]ETV93855.1 hypothetical protein H310_12207 [Aphanomyces invadans]|eukprot:XP_008877415.1 hypothetical protein H310_12207 [Aphanomyces invadans]